MIGLDVKLERVLAQALTTSGGLEPGLADTLLRETHAALERQESQGNAPVLLVSPVLRAPLSRFLRHHLPQLGVLSNTEIPDERMVRVTALIGGGQRGMKISRFFGLNSRDVMRQVRQVLGPDALIVSNRSVDGGIEVLATVDGAFDEPPDSAQPPQQRVATGASTTHHAPYQEQTPAVIMPPTAYPAPSRSPPVGLCRVGTAGRRGRGGHDAGVRPRAGARGNSAAAVRRAGADGDAALGASRAGAHGNAIAGGAPGPRPPCPRCRQWRLKATRGLRRRSSSPCRNTPRPPQPPATPPAYRAAQTYATRAAAPGPVAPAARRAPSRALSPRATARRARRCRRLPGRPPRPWRACPMRRCQGLALPPGTLPADTAAGLQNAISALRGALESRMDGLLWGGRQGPGRDRRGAVP